MARNIKTPTTKSSAKKSSTSTKKAGAQKKSATSSNYDEEQTPYTPQMRNPSYDDRHHNFHDYDESIYQRQHGHGSYAQPPEPDYGPRNRDFGYREDTRPRNRNHYPEDNFQEYPLDRNQSYQSRYESSGRQPRYVDERNHDFSSDYDEYYSYHPQSDDHHRRHGSSGYDRQRNMGMRPQQGRDDYNYQDRMQPQQTYPQGGGGRPTNPGRMQSQYGSDRGSYDQQYSRRSRQQDHFDDYDDYQNSDQSGPRRRR